MKILITGGAGFIGSHLVEHFHEQADVVVLDNLRTGNKDNLKKLHHKFVLDSILNRMALRRALRGVDYVFHLAAMISVAEATKNPVECAEINTLGTLIALEEAANAGVKKFVFSSSAAVYGEGLKQDKREGSPEAPKNIYGATKLNGEIYCRLFEAERQLPTVRVRFFNVFGPRQHIKTGVVPAFIYRALNNWELKIYGDGEQVRDFIYAKDAAAAAAFLATSPDAVGTFNVGTGSGTTINSLAALIISLCGSTSKTRTGAENSDDIRHSTAAVNRLKYFGYTPATDLEKNLKDTIAWYRR